MLFTPESKEYLKHYEKSLFEKNMEISRNDYYLPYFEKYLPIDRNIIILDAGCGNGKYADYLYNRGYKNVYAVDLFEGIRFSQITYCKASIDNLPFQREKFDFIYSNSVIYHLKNPKQSIDEFYRVLKPGGILMFSGHTRYSLHTLWRKINKSKFKNLKNATFLHTKSYINYLRTLGFITTKIDGFHVSFLFYPFYKRKIKWFENKFNIKFPVFSPRVSELDWIGKLKSNFAYHFIIVCKKP